MFFLTVYCGSNKKIKMLCPNGHECQITWDNFKQGHGCYRCRGQTSKAEIKLYEMIKNKYRDFEIKSKDRTIISPYEIDISIPEINVAIEYNGAGHHIPIYGQTMERRIENLLDTKKKDKIKREMLYNINWRHLYIDDYGPFNKKLIDRAFCFLCAKIDRIIQQYKWSTTIHIDDIS